MVLATLAFTVMVGLVKVARVELSSLEIVFWRSAVAVPLALVLAGPVGLGVRAPRLLALRTGLGFVTMVGYFTAAGGLPLANLTLITKLQPVFVALLAPLLLGLGERSGPRTGGALLLGLFGCALIVGPELESGSWYGAIAMAAALSSAGAHTCVRALGSRVHPYAQVFWFQLGVMGLALLSLLLTGRAVLPPAHLWPHLAGIGVFATVGQWLMTHAYRADRAASVAAASYAAPIWALIADVFVFALLPGPLALAGGVLVVAAGLALLLQPAGAEAEPEVEATEG